MARWAALALAAAVGVAGARVLADDEGKKEAGGEAKPAKEDEKKPDVLEKVRKLGKRFRFKFNGTHTVKTRTDKGDVTSSREEEMEWWPGAWFDRKEDLKWEGASFSAKWDGGTDAWREKAAVAGRMSDDGQAILSLKVTYRKDWKEGGGSIDAEFELKDVKLRFAGEETVRYCAEGEDAKKAVVKYSGSEDYGSAGAEDLRAKSYVSTDWTKSASVDVLFADVPY